MKNLTELMKENPDFSFADIIILQELIKEKETGIKSKVLSKILKEADEN